MMEACFNTIVTLFRKCQEVNIMVSLNNTSNIVLLKNHIVIFCYIQFTCSLCVLFIQLATGEQLAIFFQLKDNTSSPTLRACVVAVIGAIGKTSLISPQPEQFILLKVFGSLQDTISISLSLSPSPCSLSFHV